MTRPDPKVAHRLIEGRAFVMDPRCDTLHSLNDTATLIWKGLCAGDSIEKIAADLAEEFDVSTEQGLKDARAFIREAAANGLLEEKS